VVGLKYTNSTVLLFVLFGFKWQKEGKERGNLKIHYTYKEVKDCENPK
jgi:hypothetical protein